MLTMRLTIRHLFIILLVLGLFILTLYPIVDPDFWWHLRTGQFIVQSHSVPHMDPFSYNNSGKPWIAQEWLSEVIMYGLYILGGYGMLILVFSLIIIGAFLISYLRCPQNSRPYVAGFTLLLGAFATWPTWGVRPQMISLLFTSLYIFLLDRYQASFNPKYVIPLPLIMLVWVNLHAGYLLGLVVICIFFGGSLIELLTSRLQNIYRPSKLAFKPILILSGSFGASVLATLANPNGYHILVYPFQSLSSQATQQFIQEWLSPDFHQFIWQPLAWFILAIIAAGMLGKKSFSPTKILLTLVFGYAALRSMRYVPLFIIATIPILAEQIGLFMPNNFEKKPTSWIMKWISPIVVVGYLLVAGLLFISTVQRQPKAEAAAFPEAAVDWIAINQPEGNIFNSYAWGGYIIWRLYPKYKVYIDGRAFDVYGDDLLFSFMNVYRAFPGWEQTLDSHNVRLVLVEPGSGISRALINSFNWKILYEDHISIVFGKK